jgi:hypothetical protein
VSKTVLLAVVPFAIARASRRSTRERERTRRTAYRGWVVLVLSLLRLDTADVERRVRAMSDDQGT